MTTTQLQRAASLLMDGVSWEPQFEEARKDCEELRALAKILRQGAREKKGRP